MKTIKQLSHDRDLAAYSITGAVLSMLRDVEIYQVPGMVVLREQVDKFQELNAELHKRKTEAA